jgi:hypothetical protein
MVLGNMGYSGSRWPVVFNNPLVSFNSPATFMNDFLSMGYSAVFDGQGNLFMTDPDRAWIRIYWNPFQSVPAATPSPSPTETPAPGSSICQPYPNPAGGGEEKVSWCISIQGPSQVKWAVYTTAFRKVRDGSKSLNSSDNLNWDLRDRFGARVANGLYYIRVNVEGSVKMDKVLKVLVIR